MLTSQLPRSWSKGVRFGIPRPSVQSCRSGSARRADLTFLREFGRLHNTDLFYIQPLRSCYVYPLSVSQSMYITFSTNQNMSFLSRSIFYDDRTFPLSQYKRQPPTPE